MLKGAHILLLAIADAESTDTTSRGHTDSDRRHNDRLDSSISPRQASHSE